MNPYRQDAPRPRDESERKELEAFSRNVRAAAKQSAPVRVAQWIHHTLLIGLVFGVPLWGLITKAPSPFVILHLVIVLPVFCAAVLYEWRVRRRRMRDGVTAALAIKRQWPDDEATFHVCIRSVKSPNPPASHAARSRERATLRSGPAHHSVQDQGLK